jgi:ribosomal-protein-alanine N-acetyltransferase
MTSSNTRHGPPVGEGNVLDTERLRLRELPVEEVRAILDGRTVEDAVWAPGYPFDGTIGGAKLVIRMVDAGTYRPGFGFYQVLLRAIDTVVGDIGFHAAPDEHGSVEIGYGLVEKYRGMGIATEATRALVEWTLRQPGVTEVRAETDKGHGPSMRVLVKARFEETGSDAETQRFRRPRA